MMKRMVVIVLGVTALAAPLLAQTSALPLPSPVEKELAARASNVTEVTLGKNMLAFAAKFMNGKDKDDAAVSQLIQGLDGIYVRDYEFDKPDQYSMVDVERLRKQFETPEWTPIVRERDKKGGETTDVLMKVVNGESQGMFVLSAEPKELSIVLILGPIRVDQLGKLQGLAVMGAMGDLSGFQQSSHGKDKGTGKAKDKDKGKKGGGE